MADPAWFRLYGKLPVFAQNVACSLAGLKMRRQRYNRTFHEALDFLNDSQWWPLSDQQAYRDEQLRGILDHAYRTVPYYREVFDRNKLSPKDIRGAEDLPKLPLLDKDTVRSRFSDLLSAAVPPKRRVHGHTGGTTGTALDLMADVDTQPWQWAVWWRHRMRFGLALHEPFIVFAGRSVVPLSKLGPPFWRENLPLRQTYVSVHHLTRQNMAPLAAYLRRRHVAYYCGYPSAMYLVARYFLDHGIRLPRPPRLIVTAAETVLPYQRQALAEAFGADVADQYGASEHCGNISECAQHSYHVDMEFGAVEFLPIEGLPSNVRRIVCTGFRNRAMPLIRYVIGDVATLADGPCACGRQAPRVEKIDGRIESYITTPDGRQLGRLDFLFKDSVQIKEAQLIQDTPDHVLVKLVEQAGYGAKDEAALLKEMRHYLGDVIRIDIDHVAEIPRGANGKFRQIVSNVWRDPSGRGASPAADNASAAGMEHGT